MKTLILDESKWRCGDYHASPENRRGEGLTLLLNQNGEMCCLGQFSLQLLPKLSEAEIRNVGTPRHTERRIPLLTRSNKEGGLVNTKLAQQAMIINDDPDTTVTKKVSLLRKLFNKKGYKIRFKKR